MKTTFGGNVKLAEKIGQPFISRNINITNVTVLGKFIHIETFKKYEKVIVETFTQAGYKILKAGENFKGNFQISVTTGDTVLSENIIDIKKIKS